MLSSIVLLVTSALAFSSARKVPDVEYDVIVVGGGPSGLSATSALCRVNRKVIMFDNEEYRNGATRNMHDVIGNDGTRPADFRTAARTQISKYGTAVFKKAKVMEITSIASPDGFVWFVARDDKGLPYTARRVVLATGVTDLLPSTPNFLENFGKGFYWCPWCDGFEHREQSLGVVGPLSDALSSALEMYNMNPDIIVMTNGTDTPEQRQKATDRSPTWREQFAAYNISIVNTTITSLTRLRDQNGRPVAAAQKGAHSDQQLLAAGSSDNIDTFDDTSGPNGKHKDLFRVQFADGLSVERAALLVNIDVKQTSHLPQQMQLRMNGSKIEVTPKMETNRTGVFAVGDANNDGSTNVPHAMYTGKKAAVVVHVQLAKEESLASIAKRSVKAANPDMSEKLIMRSIGNELEAIWDRIQ